MHLGCFGLDLPTPLGKGIRRKTTNGEEGFDIFISSASGSGNFTWNKIYEFRRDKFRFLDTSGNPILDCREISGETRFIFGGTASSSSPTSRFPVDGYSTDDFFGIDGIDAVSTFGLSYYIKVDTKSQSDFSSVTENNLYILVRDIQAP